MASQHHFGCRIVQTPDNNLFLTQGEHFRYRDEAQNLGNHLGKLVRIAPDGSVPQDNPFVGRPGAKPEIWSYGHRNMQGAALHPTTGKLWEHEHGPRGGDEVNIIEKGRNYGWPVIAYGKDYGGGQIGAGITAQAGMEQPLYYWDPSMAPSGMAFVGSNPYGSDWRGNLLAGSLKFGYVARLTLDGERVVREEKINVGERVRDVERARKRVGRVERDRERDRVALVRAQARPGDRDRQSRHRRRQGRAGWRRRVPRRR